MEWLVTKKLEEMENKVLAWDPDEYTEAFRQELKIKRAEKPRDQACDTKE